MKDAVIRHLEDEHDYFFYKSVPETIEEVSKRTFSEKVDGINLLKEQVKEKISENPGANVTKLLDEIPDTSQRSIERILRQLKKTTASSIAQAGRPAGTMWWKRTKGTFSPKIGRK